MKIVMMMAAICATALAGRAAAQTNVDPNHAVGWGENVGWSNWYGDGLSSGTRVGATILSGYVWFENIGWLNLGSGAPANGVHYANIAPDFGVNIDSSGDLYGLAWSENVGWVNFDTSAAGTDRARLDYCSRLRGFAWGENIGWINLDDASRFVGLSAGQAPPSGTPSLSVALSGGNALVSWTILGTATAYDTVRGDLVTLHGTAGNFTVATAGCLGNDVLGVNTAQDATVPAAGQGRWYLTRGVNCGGVGTYDSLAVSQVGLRDAEVNASMLACP